MFTNERRKPPLKAVANAVKTAHPLQPKVPLAFLISLPFALIASVLSIIGAVVFVIGIVLSCICPCCICCALLANLAIVLVKLPLDVVLWFVDFIPC